MSGSVTGLAQIKKFAVSLAGLGLPSPWGARQVDVGEGHVIGVHGDVLVGVTIAPNGSLLLHADRRTPLGTGIPAGRARARRYRHLCLTTAASTWWASVRPVSCCIVHGGSVTDRMTTGTGSRSLSAA